MSNEIPDATIETFARTICREAKNYGFGLGDMIRLVNSVLDASTEERAKLIDDPSGPIHDPISSTNVSAFPLVSSRLKIRLANADKDAALLATWVNDEYGRHFLLSSSTAQSLEINALLSNSSNQVGIIEVTAGEPIGAMAFLDIDNAQRRAELRKLIGAPDARGRGLAAEATRLWAAYGLETLGLEKIYVSTLQTHLPNIQLNESIGFHVEGVLRQEVRIGEDRFDVLRMAMTAAPGRSLPVDDG